MTFTEWQTSVFSYLDVDGTRRGVDTLRTSYLKGAIADLKHFVPAFAADGKQSYSGTDPVPFNERAAEAAAMYLKSRFVRLTEKDLALASSYESDYVKLRRKLISSSNDESHTVTALLPSENIAVVLGDSIPFKIVMELDENGAPWSAFTNYLLYFSVFEAGDEDEADDAIIALTNGAGGGITAAAATATWAIPDTDASLWVGDFTYSVQLKNTVTSQVFTIRKGTITINPGLRPAA